MSGVGLVASIAKDALAAQRYGLDVTAHNIANVNTEGYSRQNSSCNTFQTQRQGSEYDEVCSRERKSMLWPGGWPTASKACLWPGIWKGNAIPAVA